MFHLTPQERCVLIGFVCICLCGALIHMGLQGNARALKWTTTSSQKIKKRPPDINKDPAFILEKIDGIGPKTAQRIVAYRKQNGYFMRLEDLRKVKGITQKNFEKIKAFYAEVSRHE